MRFVEILSSLLNPVSICNNIKAPSMPWFYFLSIEPNSKRRNTKSPKRLLAVHRGLFEVYISLKLWSCTVNLLTWFNAWTSRRANATFTANPTNPNELILFGGEFYDGQRGAWLQIWDRLLDWYYMDLNRHAPITKIFLVFLHIQYICTMTFTGTLSSYYLNYLCTYFHYISLNVTFF